MLQLIRNRASSWVIKFILGLIIVVFVFFGWGANKSGKINQVAKVNGETITLQQYKDAYNLQLSNLKARFGGNLSSQLIEMFQVEKQALNGLIDQTLIRQKADELGMKVSDAELSDYIANIEYFLTDGKFDHSKYTSLLAMNGMSPQGFEAKVKTDILLERVAGIVTGAVKVTDKELMEWYEFNNKTTDIKYAAFIPEKYKKEDFKVEDDEIKSYYEENRENYKSQEMVKVVYARFAADDFRGDITVEDEDIKGYYEDHLEEYKTPEKVKARHILIKVAENADEKEIEEAKKRLADVKKKIDSGKSFEEMAKKYSEGPSGATGGDLGEFGKKDMVAPFSKVAFELKEGEISEPVKTNFGWHLIKVEKKMKESVKTLEMVKNEIKERLIKRQSKMAAYDKADAIYNSTLKGSTLEEEADAGSVKLITTDFFTRSGPAVGIINPGNFAKEAFSFDVDETSEIIEGGDNLYLLQVKEKKAPEILPMEDVKDKIADILISQKQEEKAENDAKEYLKAVIAKKSMEVDSEIKPSEFKSVSDVQRKGYVKDLGTLAELQTEIFKRASMGEIFPEEVIKSGKGFYIFEIENVKSPSKEDFEKEKEELKKRMITRKRSYLYTKWLDNEKSKSSITISEQFRK